MSDPDKLHSAIVKGDNAQRMTSGGNVDKAAYHEAVVIFKAELMKRWQSCNDATERDRIWISVNMVDKIEEAFVHVAANGRFAKKQLEELIASK